MHHQLKANQQTLNVHCLHLKLIITAETNAKLKWYWIYWCAVFTGWTRRGSVLLLVGLSSLEWTQQTRVALATQPAGSACKTMHLLLHSTYFFCTNNSISLQSTSNCYAMRVLYKERKQMLTSKWSIIDSINSSQNGGFASKDPASGWNSRIRLSTTT